VARKIPNHTVNVAHNSQVGISSKISFNEGVYQGVCFFAKIITPDYPNNVTINVSIYDAVSDKIFSFADLVKNATHIFSDLQIPLVEREYFEVELSGVPGGNPGDMWPICITLYYTSDYR
jgi:hypothetical protein